MMKVATSKTTHAGKSPSVHASVTMHLMLVTVLSCCTWEKEKVQTLFEAPHARAAEHGLLLGRECAYTGIPHVSGPPTGYVAGEESRAKIR